MKKVFGFFIGFALVMAATLFTSCAQSYNGKYYDVTFIPKVTEDEYDVYESHVDPIGGVVEVYRLSLKKPGAEKKRNLTESEFINYMRINNANEAFIRSILNDVKESGEIIYPYDYFIGEDRYYDFYHVIEIK